VDGYLASGQVTKAQRFPVFDNINAATVKGIEFSLVKRLDRHVSGFFNYTYSEALTTSSVLFSLARDMSRTFPADWDQTHTASFGISLEFPEKWGCSILGSASSGLPYTYNQWQPNAERAPWIGSLDAMAYKEFEFAGLSARLFFQVMNILNRRNVWWVYADSGQPGIDANPSTSDDYTNNPAMWGPGRRMQAGVTFSFQ
jgi:outer membrane receptor protein involved in Fe transport